MPNSAAPGPGSTKGEDAIARLAGIDQLDVRSGVRQCGNQAEMYRYMLGRFVQLYGQGAPRLADSVAAADWGGLREAVHSLRGASATIGAIQVHRLASELEQRCASVDPGEPAGRKVLVSGAEELQQALLCLVAQLRPRLAQA